MSNHRIETTENLVAEIAECTSRYSGLILNQLDMAFPKCENRDLVRRAILNSLGDRGLIAEIKIILKYSEMNNIGGVNE